MSSKSDILASIRQHTTEVFERPDLSILQAKATT